MALELIAYIGRDNEERLELKQDGVLVPVSTVTAAVFRFGEYCIDSEVDTDLIYFLNSDNQVLCMKLGGITGLVVGKYKKGTLTIFDALSTNGVAWSIIDVNVQAWDVCPVAPVIP